jgi:dolichyl-diphosphooligosaccharide--protein glycosyltransferase
MTVPYSTTGYDQWGPENGHTNVSTRATGDYQFTTGVQRADDGSVVRYTDSASVTEAQVIGEDDSAVQVELSEEVLREPSEDGGSTDSGTDGNSTSEQSRVAGPERTVATP